MLAPKLLTDPGVPDEEAVPLVNCEDEALADVEEAEEVSIIDVADRALAQIATFNNWISMLNNVGHGFPQLQLIQTYSVGRHRSSLTWTDRA